MTTLKHLAISFAGTAIAVAVIYRVPFLRNLVVGNSPN